MSKIICEVCGTSYPDTAAQCPICGYANPGTGENAVETSKTEEPRAGYEHVKGGRFSKSNVKKRNQGKPPVVHNTTTEKAAARNSRSVPKSGGDKTASGKKSTGLIVTTIVLLLAIVGVVVYLSLRFFGPGADKPNLPAIPNVTNPAQSDPTQTVPVSVPCEMLTIDVTEVFFNKAGSSRMIYAQPEPANTTDAVVFTSDNESVATVSQTGMITAVGSGTANVTVSCGVVNVTCVVTCDIPEETTPETTADSTEGTEETTEATEETTEATEPSEIKSPIYLNRKDITFNTKGSTWTLYEGTVAKNNVTFLSDDESIATFVDGVVKAVGSGTTKVHVQYAGEETQTCIIRCTFKNSQDVEGNGGGVGEDDGGTKPTAPAPTDPKPTEPTTQPTENGGNSGAAAGLYTPFGLAQDITMKVGEVLQFTLKDSSGNPVAAASWSAGDASIQVASGSVAAVSPTKSTTVSATDASGNVFTCVIRVVNG